MPAVSNVNVLFLHHGDAHVRGSEIALINAIEGLLRRGVIPVVVCNQPVMAEALWSRTKIRALVRSLPRVMWDDHTLEFNPIKILITLRELLRLIKTSKIDVIYCNGGRGAQIAYYASRFAGVPVIAHVHCAYTKRYILLYRLTKVDRLVFVSRDTEIRLISQSKPRHASSVVYNGIDTAVFCPSPTRRIDFRRALGIPAEAPVVGQVSSMTFAKGVDVLLRAFKLVSESHPDSHLVLIGDGRDFDRLQMLCVDLGLSGRAHFLRERRKPWLYYQHLFDINVLASRQDALGLTLIEGASCGLPGVASNVGGMPEVVREGISGLLFTNEDHASLASKLRLLMEQPDLRRELGSKARRMVEEEFSLESYSSRLEAIIKELHSSRTRAEGRNR